MSVGPEEWGELFPKQCGTTMKRQSPINIEIDDAKHDEHLEDIDIRQPDEDDMDKRMYLYNDGHSGNPYNSPMVHYWKHNSQSTQATRKYLRCLETTFGTQERLILSS